MTYAALSFSATVTAGQRLKDIAKVITGAATVVTSLEFATQGSSEIVATEPAGWTMADSGSALETSGTATRVEYRFRAPCVNTSKTKYAAIASYTGYSGQGTNTRNAATDTSGVLYLYTGSGVSGNAMVNTSVIPLSYGQSGSYAGAWNPTINIGGTAQYIISVTNRKIVIVAPSVQNSSINGIQAHLEFPETSATNLYNNVPSVAFCSYAPTTASSGVNSLVKAGTSSTGTINRIIATTQWYRQSDGARSNRFMDDSSTFPYCPTLPVAGIDPGTGLTQNPLIPILDFRHQYGEGVHDYSALTDLYFTRTVGHLDTITVGGDTYVGLTQNNRYFCVKKA